jgi:hypothetical protein
MEENDTGISWTWCVVCGVCGCVAIAPFPPMYWRVLCVPGLLRVQASAIPQLPCVHTAVGGGSPASWLYVWIGRLRGKAARGGPCGCASCG